MTTYTAVLDFPAALSAPHVCPWCGGALDPGRVGGHLAFACPDCAEAWRFELGRRPSIADHPHAPEIPPPGQVRVAPLENDDDSLYPPRH